MLPEQGDKRAGEGEGRRRRGGRARQHGLGRAARAARRLVHARDHHQEARASRRQTPNRYGRGTPQLLTVLTKILD